VSDFEDVGSYDSPQMPENIIAAITDLIIDEGESSHDRIDDDINDLIEVVGMEHMENLKNYLMRDNIAEILCSSPVFVQAVARRVGEFYDALSGIDFNDNGDL